jgi:hypothetical protein
MGKKALINFRTINTCGKKITVQLLGTGLPAFYVADLGDMNFTLGLSGWTNNDWSHGGNFDLLAPRMTVDNNTKLKVVGWLQKN